MLDIFSNIEKQLANENCTLGEFNQHVRDMIIKYCENQERAEYEVQSAVEDSLTEVDMSDHGNADGQCESKQSRSQQTNTHKM